MSRRIWSPERAYVRISKNLLIGGDQVQSVDPGRGHQKTIHGIGMKRFRQRIGLFNDIEVNGQACPSHFALSFAKTPADRFLGGGLLARARTTVSFQAKPNCALCTESSESLFSGTICMQHSLKILERQLTTLLKSNT